jgi:archaellin
LGWGEEWEALLKLPKKLSGLHHECLHSPAGASVFIRTRSHIIRKTVPEILAVRWQSLLLIGMLIVAVLAAGCTDEEATGPVAQPAVDVVQPGQVLTLVGDVTGDGIAGGTIDTITFTVGLVPGKGPVDMEKITIYYADTIQTETLVPVEGFRGDPPQGDWGILNVTNEISKSNNRIEDTEQFTIRINPRAYLPANRMVIIAVRSPTGTPLTIRRFAPPTIIKENNLLAPR